MTKGSSIPEHLKTPEIKRRVKSLLKAAQEVGFDFGSLRLTAEGEIILLDKATVESQNDTDSKWLGE